MLHWQTQHTTQDGKQKLTAEGLEIDLTEFKQGIYFLNISGYKSVKLVR